MYSLILAFVMLSSCGSKSSSSDVGLAKEESAAMTLSEPSPVSETTKFTPPSISEESSGSSYSTTISIKIPSKIKKTADLNITVDDYKKARIEIEKIVKSGNGYIGSENEQNTTYSITNDMVIRVVNKDFDAMVSKLLTVASNVNSKNISAEDVTAEFVDIQSRLKSKKEIEKRYVDILQKASKVSDILEIEEKIGEIREEIEAKEGELKLLSDQVDYSTININFHQEFEYTPIDKPGFFGRLGNAFGNGWSGFLSFVVGMVYAWPLWVIIGLISYFLVRFIKRKIKK